MDIHKMNKAGYGKEEDYFYRLNKSLLDRRRDELDRRLEPENKPANWMLCPKCGHHMDQKELMKIRVEHCPECGGVFFDSDELQTILTSQEPQSYLAGVREWVL